MGHQIIIIMMTTVRQQIKNGLAKRSSPDVCSSQMSSEVIQEEACGREELVKSLSQLQAAMKLLRMLGRMPRWCPAWTMDSDGNGHC